MPRGIYIKKENVKYGNSGKKASYELIKKLSDSHKGQKAWNKGIKTGPNPKMAEKKRGIKASIETRKKMSESHKGRKPYEMTNEIREKTRQARKNQVSTNKGKTWKLSGEKLENVRKAAEKRRGANNSRYLHDRTKLKKHDRRNDVSYKVWRTLVYQRDGYKCKISNEDCNGRLEAHHILGWNEYKELRYDTNNGITLCHHHHPRKRIDEKEKVNLFKQLITLE